jgi:PAS domain S-box-containing protein
METNLPTQKILIVDDDPISLSLLTEMLIPDYEISCATNGTEALEILDRYNDFDLILLDVVMPRMNGYETMERLKVSKHTANIPVIFITAETAETEETRGLKQGAVDYIAKPFSRDIIQARIGNQLELKRYRDQLETLVRLRTEEIRNTNAQLQAEILERKHAQAELTTYQNHLEEIVEKRTAELKAANRRLSREISERKNTEALLTESETYLRTIMTTVQTGLFIIDPYSGKIIDANPCALSIMGCDAEDVIGRDYDEFSVRIPGDAAAKTSRRWESEDTEMRTARGGTIHARKSFAEARLKDRDLLVHSFLDITDLQTLLAKQEINIDLSKKILSLINGPIPRYTPLKDNRTLFAQAVSIPSHAEGGDHFFLRPFPRSPERPPCTVISVKDQSGHEVGCILRSIITDLLHQSLLARFGPGPMETVLNALNDEIIQSKLFRAEDFFTAAGASIDHATLTLRYVLNGHPSFFFIRGPDVRLVPGPEGNGKNLPIGVVENADFTAGEIQLETGDILIFFTDGFHEMPTNGGKSAVSVPELQRMARRVFARQSHPTAVDAMYGLLAAMTEYAGETVSPSSANTSGDDVTLLCLQVEPTDSWEQFVIRPVDGTDVSRSIRTLYKRLSGMWRARGFPNPESRLQSVLEEAVINAWRHGNREAPGREIRIRWRFGNDFHLQVTDEGSGFDPACIDDPTTADNLDKPCGRGIFLIRYFSDECRWDQGGRRLTVRFGKRYPTDSQPFLDRPKSDIDLWKGVHSGRSH